MIERFRRHRRLRNRNHKLLGAKRSFARLESLEQRLLLTITDVTTNTTYLSIQAAVNGANPGDTILVDAGTYSENVTVNKPLILEGAQHGVDAQTRSGAETILDASGNGGKTPFYVTANDVTIDGFTIENTTDVNQFGYGILEGPGTSGTQILNNIIQNNIIGLGLSNASSGSPGLVQHNLIRNNNQPGAGSGAGIYSDQSVAGGTLTSVVIDANTFSGNTGDAGIDFSTTDATKPATDITISNNVFNANARGLVAFNLTSSSITSNTFSNSTDSATADLRLFEGDSALKITNNLLENGAGRAVRISNSGTGSPDATNITFNYNSISGYTGPAGTFEVDNYTGTLDASKNWWGNLSGPTIATNTGGSGQTIVGSQVNYRPWLIYAPDSDATAPGVQLPATVNVTAPGDVSPAVNDYTTLANAIESAADGQTFVLSGTFDWTTSNPDANAAWALGVDATANTNDDYMISAPAGVSGVTVTAASLGNATIQGPGSLPISGNVSFFQPTFLGFNGGPNQNWTISNLRIFDFNDGIYYGYQNTSQTAYNGTTITNNYIRVPALLNQAVAGALNFNVGLNISYGANQTISNNQIDLDGSGTNVSGQAYPAAETGILSNSSGGAIYDGLKITGNTINVLHAQSATPEQVNGIWENADSTSNITVSGNTFKNLAAGNDPALNDQVAFRLTSPSSPTSTVVYQSNQVSGAHDGFQYYPGYDNSGTLPVQFIGNTLTNVYDGFSFDNAKSVDYLSGNTVTGTGTAGTGVAVGTGSTLTTDGISGTNAISGFATGVNLDGGTGTLIANTITGNGVGVTVGAGGTLVSASQNFITGNTGEGIDIGAAAASVGPINNNDLSGNGGQAVDNSSATVVDASGNWWGSISGPTVASNPGGTGAAVSTNVDYSPWLDSGTDLLAGPGFQGDFSNLTVNAGSPRNPIQVAALAGNLQDGVNDVTAGGTVNVLAGTYAENVTINKNLTLTGPAVSPPTAVIHPAAGDGITISAPATDVTVKNFEITGATNGIVASNLTTLTLSNLNLTGNAAGGTITNVATVNDTPIIGATGATDTITGSSIQRNNDDTLTYSGVTNLNVFGSDGSDTFNVTPTPSTAISVDGGLPNPPATPGDTLNLSSYAGATLTSSFNPNAGAAGQWTFNNGNQPVSFSHIETLGNVAAPAITSAGSTTFTVGTVGTFSVTATGSPTPTLVETGALPGGVTFVDNGNGTATLAGTPAAGTGGVYNITVTAENGGLPPATQAFVLTVDQAPAITSANSADFAEGSSNTFSVTATGFPAPTLTESGALPSGLTFVDNGNGTATLSGTPATGTHGVYTLTITAHNGVASDATQTFTLTVSAAVIQSSPFGYLAGVPGDGTAQTFVHNLYRELLGREPDALGQTFWVNYLQQHDTPAGRQQVISGFMNSQEYETHYVTTLYQVLLGRGPDAPGLQYWVGQMGNPGTPGGHNGSSDEKFIFSAIMGSSEFYADAGGTPQGFAQALYQDILGRTGESAGVDAWAALVQLQPNNRDGIVRLFVSSPEADHLLLDSFYPAPGGTASHPLPLPGNGVAAGSDDLAVLTGDGWENLYLEGPFDGLPEGNDAFFAELAGGAAWDDIQFQILNSDQFYNNGNHPVTA